MRYTALRLIIFAIAAFIIMSGVVAAQTNIEVFRNIRVSNTTDLNGPTTVAGGLTVEDTGLTVTAGGATVTAGGLTVTAGGATVTAGDVGITAGDLTISSGTLAIEETDNVATGAQTITPTKTYYHFAPTAVTTVTLATGAAVEGDLLILHNIVSTNTVIVDTGATQGGGNITLGQDDPAGFIFGDGVWVELFSPDNS